eukprot:330876_1
MFIYVMRLFWKILLTWLYTIGSTFGFAPDELDVWTGLPKIFSVDTTQSTTVYSYDGAWKIRGNMYTTIDVYYGEDPKIGTQRLWWSSSDNSWSISEHIDEPAVAKCFNPILHECTEGIILKYCLNAPKSNGYYRFNSTVN